MSRLQYLVVMLCISEAGFQLFVFASVIFESESEIDSSRFTEGKQKYEAIKRDTKMPKYGTCWTQALTELENGCKELSDDTQHRLALMFANCFLLKTGRKTYKCKPNDELAECTKHMSPEAYNVYIEFFTHTQNICFFLQAQLWQELTEDSISRLKDNSEFVAQQIEDSSIAQSELLKKQNISIENQEIILQHGSKLQKALRDSTVDVNKMLIEFKSSTTEQRQLIFEVFDKVNVLQNVVMGEFTGVYSLIFYAVAILISYLLTSTARTSGARFWLFVLMTINIVMERSLVFWGAYPAVDNSGHILDENTVIYYRLSICRKIFIFFALLVLTLFAYKYQDINKLNNILLMEIRQQNSELKHLLQAPDHSNTSQLDGLAYGRPNALPPVANQRFQSASCTQLAQMSATLSVADDVLEKSISTYSISRTSSKASLSDSDFESDSSSDSAETDRTFIADMSNGNESDCSSFVTSSRYSRESTPALWDEVSYLRNCTPLREMTPIPGVTEAAETSMQCTLHSTLNDFPAASPRRRGRPPGCRKSAPSMSPVPNHYNLRSRRGLTNILENPVVESETAEDFGKTIKHLSQVALRNRVKAMASAQRLGRKSSPGGLKSPKLC